MRTDRRALALATLVLAGCTTFSDDGGFGEVQKIASERLGSNAVWQRTDEDAARAREDVQRLLAKELSVGDAVQIGRASCRERVFRTV